MALVSRELRAYFNLESTSRSALLAHNDHVEQERRSATVFCTYLFLMNTIKGMQSLSLCGPGLALGA